jgi:4-aminobutyrate aminotransferase
MKWSAGAHGSTFGGNPVACAAALATLDLVEGSLTDNAAQIGDLLFTRLKELQAKEQLLTDVRGRGLMIGIDFPDHDTAFQIEQACFRRGLLVLTCGERAVRFAPALTIRPDQAEAAVSILADACAEVAS